MNEIYVNLIRALLGDARLDEILPCQIFAEPNCGLTSGEGMCPAMSLPDPDLLVRHTHTIRAVEDCVGMPPWFGYFIKSMVTRRPVKVGRRGEGLSAAACGQDQERDQHQPSDNRGRSEQSPYLWDSDSHIQFIPDH